VIFIVVLCAHKIMFMHVPLVFCLALAGNSNKLQLQAICYMLHATILECHVNATPRMCGVL